MSDENNAYVAILLVVFITAIAAMSFMAGGLMYHSHGGNGGYNGGGGYYSEPTAPPMPYVDTKIDNISDGDVVEYSLSRYTNTMTMFIQTNLSENTNTSICFRQDMKTPFEGDEIYDARFEYTFIRYEHDITDIISRNECKSIVTDVDNTLVTIYMNFREEHMVPGGDIMYIDIGEDISFSIEVVK